MVPQQALFRLCPDCLGREASGLGLHALEREGLSPSVPSGTTSLILPSACAKATNSLVVPLVPQALRRPKGLSRSLGALEATEEGRPVMVIRRTCNPTQAFCT